MHPSPTSAQRSGVLEIDHRRPLGDCAESRRSARRGCGFAPSAGRHSHASRPRATRGRTRCPGSVMSRVPTVVRLRSSCSNSARRTRVSRPPRSRSPTPRPSSRRPRRTRRPPGTVSPRTRPPRPTRSRQRPIRLRPRHRQRCPRPRWRRTAPGPTSPHWAHCSRATMCASRAAAMRQQAPRHHGRLQVRALPGSRSSTSLVIWRDPMPRSSPHETARSHGFRGCEHRPTIVMFLSYRALGPARRAEGGNCVDPGQWDEHEDSAGGHADAVVCARRVQGRGMAPLRGHHVRDRRVAQRHLGDCGRFRLALLRGGRHVHPHRPQHLGLDRDRASGRSSSSPPSRSGAVVRTGAGSASPSPASQLWQR